jgi:hypothetical protein
MTRNRINGLTGEKIALYAYFYKQAELFEPSSIGTVHILNSSGSILASIPASNISSIYSGVKKLNFDIPVDYKKGHYVDKWNRIIEQTGVDSKIAAFTFKIVEAEYNTQDSMELPRFSLDAKLEMRKFDLYEKKWLTFDIRDANGLMGFTDSVSILFKDFNGSNVYIASTATINDGMKAYYFFNSSKLQSDFPDLINRETDYAWILRVYYKENVFQLDPIQFNFT